MPAEAKMKPWANMCSVNINPVSEEGLMTRVWACLYNQLRFRSRGDTEVMKCVSGAGTLLHNAIKRKYQSDVV